MYNGLFDLPWWGYVVVALALTHVTIAAVTIFLHRHQAHRALDLHPVPSHFFRFWLWLTTGMVTREWAAIHRKHHAKCETVEDPHSPQTRGLAKVLWQGAELYRAEAKNAETLARYGHGTPDDWLERNVYRHSVLGVSIMLVIDLIAFGPIGLTIWAVQMVWIPFWAAGVVNGLAHYWGYRNYDCSDASRNILPWGILIGGEELHNNHHSFATSAKLSARWYEFDIGWMYIRMLEMLGLAKVKKTIPKPRLVEAKAVPDLDTLQAVVTHRYDVMTNYMHSLRKLCAAELKRVKRDAVSGLDVRAVRRWVLSGEERHLGDAQKEQVRVAVGMSPALATVVAMREELAAIWARSNASREQLLAQLQDWVTRAEQSGIAQLQEFALRLRRYAV
ncbi:MULTISPECIES: fatty acid desaturase [unclassified Thauera]|uniref:DesA family fatty acid desaturase n=1 Tax=unclassified Thauera TaxID=2609274 RepID=UPI0002CD6F60|nr:MULTISPECIES: fatty acid desaturase [unclassified Thauera]ENO83022.1 fatty acid desaturase [Thauera sp. 27]ENO94708.1 fatty acid desaturase [Thauera sp. 28]WBL65628.1 fatty acid desaturase [Thauera sp. WB-2]HAG75239.1 acyl-CoA desaturase [Thauera sp.]HAY10834.1 acyl-CoA desaturase [Thauera sp.]